MSCSGLESIALAVAHLERVQSQEDHDELPTAPATTSSSSLPMAAAAAAAAFSQTCPSTSFCQAPRLVSQDYSSPRDSPQLDQEPPTTVSPKPSAAGPVVTPHGSFSGEPAPERTASSVSTANALKLLNNNKPTNVPIAPCSLPRRNSARPLKNLEQVFEPSDFNSPNAPPSPDLKAVFHQVQDDDVLCGRGGETNHHPGNIQYRVLVKACQPAYLAAKRRDKPRIAAGIVLAVRKVGGRFLKKEGQNSWKDVGNTRAREKTSQALREGAPELRTSNESDPAPSPHQEQHQQHVPLQVMSTAPAVPRQHPHVLLLPKGHPNAAAMLSMQHAYGLHQAQQHAAQQQQHHHHLAIPPTQPPADRCYNSQTVVPNVIDAALVMGNLIKAQEQHQRPPKKVKAATSAGGIPQRPQQQQPPLPHAMMAEGFQPWCRPGQQPPLPQQQLPPSNNNNANGCFVATISGDDDDDSSSDQPKKKGTGPRIKRLKRRLEEMRD